ncbi:hypothetical protein GNI_167730 [Gregarina niphandrodes]|uniref:Uncharacterized protein n=1 Tax=Gregarina niphandrodes TaxID=110365 RepID=A0A023AY09_GRENI|nr:hypothetical protein GNI_167730 [Gregarina niphandrodes]EZG43541.1 hypothetical protein GNI_167730 [Gregarina niphandrodes]|eukprot:XP_011133226.1 hypothetical protein GNI_167730 [Gregarina niphandrodes]
MACGYPEDKVVRIMPNTPTEVGKGSTAITAASSARSTEAYTQVYQWLSQATGLVTEIPEKDFSKFTASYGCSPAYNYLIFEALNAIKFKIHVTDPLRTRSLNHAVWLSLMRLPLMQFPISLMQFPISLMQFPI